MILLYWKIFDGINLSDELIKEIMTKGTNPETLGRLARFANTDILSEKAQSEETQHDSMS